MLKLVKTVLSLTLFLSACGGSPPSEKPLQIFDDSRCPFTLHPSQITAAGTKQTVRCGNLNLLEDRDSGSERRIQVPVVVFKSKHAQEAPLVELAGGPGQSWGDLGLEQLTASDNAAFSRDLIFIEQRGTGRSTPNLSCPELEATSMDNMGMNMDPLITCRDRLRASGVQLSAYNTRAMAVDVDDMRRALGYKMMILSGTSFGTIWALEVMRQFPQTLDRVVLDSVVAPQRPLLSNLSSGRDGALTALFTACKADPTCDGAFPNLETKLLSSVGALEHTPLNWILSSGGKFTSSDFVSAIDDVQFYQPELLPFFIETISKTITDGGTTLDGADSRVQATMMRSGTATSSLAIGMYLSVFCDLNQKVTDEQVQADVAKARTALHPYFRNSSLALLTVCRDWGVKQVDASAFSAVSSDVPTMILSGGLDPRTPPAWAADAAKTLSRGSLLTFPGLSHSVMSTDSTTGQQCLGSAFGQFFTSDRVSDTSCTDRVLPQWIVR